MVMSVTHFSLKWTLGYLMSSSNLKIGNLAEISLKMKVLELVTWISSVLCRFPFRACSVVVPPAHLQTTS